MRSFSKLGLALCATATLAFTGCQQYTQPQNPVNTQPENNQFNLQGKIGVKTPKQSGSAFFNWEQQQDNFDIELTGILGVGKTQIQGRPGEVTLNSAKTGLIRATTPEELLERATGWQAPITHLVHWVQGRPASLNAKIKKDEQQRISTIQEQDWNVELSYNGNAQQPNKLILKQSLDNGQENRITMLIQNR
ncbi:MULTISPECIES: lipoprotein insertase outer membrane protein LolB [Acinetobacter]|uniref:lipoprotein insertase outer membrane protein LolB n=1 Tax=Acinetobacter TaxID=469 RepID=UPI000DAB445E|nr:lipoprotein insertase outer membrane protein LolB [Acinetobacter radioresistens]AWV85668.1 outer membrane lipoprotein LolB [Acinetobacter radioresistens]MCK4080654.1 outer membrane lipoprotein LolB [Acinetobacter radioresistens]MCK4091147.1 outer membrane lipoprotein LolB [Acinetobacter radioresistens]MCU4500517.1 lipoprotein insertase outer membrane protein LolB [Acinetobacter radioresistens]MCX0329003.1 lipoprotein insertase outer membrane protein LolB [Acinetobacter radioresistens]